ncbi:MAG: dTMP kinase [Elusimicrobia bacterium]|nr:dTMP kinase [Elusimicrobiota bacterium]
MSKNKGLFIVFEGPDRSGKTTQINLLAEALNKKRIKFLITREPGGCPLSEKIRDLLLDPKNNISPMAELLLYEAARAQHTAEKILPALKRGEVVISDRFFLATLAYQGYGRKIDLSIVRKLNSVAALGLKPDLTFLFLMPDREFEKRDRKKDGLNPDRIEREKADFRKKVNSAYRKLALTEKNIISIDATLKVEKINEFILKKLKLK